MTNFNFNGWTWINAANEASAILDADKTFNGPETVRCYIGTVGQLLNDIRREG